MAIRVKGTGTPDFSETKRMYAPGLVVEADCPSCGNAVEVDFDSMHLRYPTHGETIEICFWCDGDG